MGEFLFCYLWADLGGAALEGALGAVLYGGAWGALGKVEAARMPREAVATNPRQLCLDPVLHHASAPAVPSCFSSSPRASVAPGCSPASSGTQSKREPRTPGGAVLHVHGFWDHLLDQKVPNRRGNDRVPALTAAEEQHGSRRGRGEPHPALAPCEGPRGFVLERQSREAEAPAVLANT